MPAWQNWSGRHRARPRAVPFVRSEADAVGVVRTAVAERQRVRVAGSGHSHAPLVPSEGVIVDASGLAGVVSTDAAARRVRVWAGTKVYALGRPLHDAGLALKNQGDIDRQAIAGATATGTHGTGRTLKNLSASVAGARLVTAAGEIVECSATREPDVWQVARLNLGALGVVTQLELDVREAYCLKERAWTVPLAELLPEVPKLADESRHFEFFWYPQTDEANAKAICETDEEPVYPLADEGSRQAWSYEVLPNHRPHLHTEMEYSVPAEQGPACMAEIGRLIREAFPEVRWPVEYRSLAADDVWLSTAYQRDTVTISVHQGIEADETEYFRACEAVFRSFDGRPHWGKVNYLEGETLAAIHPRWADWWRVRDGLDPEGTFLNDYLLSIRP